VTVDRANAVSLAGRVAFITGGGRGIGAGIAAAFARAGARVFLVARSEAELERTAATVADGGGVARFAAVDVSQGLALAASVSRCTNELGPVDVLVNAAAIYGPIGRTWEVDAADWLRAVEVNLLGTLHACQAVIPGMVERQAGRIINLSGGGATAPLPRFSAYAATKAAVVRLTETLAEELRPYGVQVNAIAPGAVDTRLQDEVLEAGERAGELHERMRRLRSYGEGATPIQVPVELALFLASERAGELTGRLISAPHDAWRTWDGTQIRALMEKPWLTLRRLDPHTLGPLMDDMARSV
jgi:NAD(P)-dependent dehydrogenase (short-subunit alcohol dehydrogenase family)